jgi:predicted Fe-Mo cluster-binding NifX family protein
MKIAIPSMDGKDIAAHFGRANQFLIFTTANGQIVAREERRNTHTHHHHSGQRRQHHNHDDLQPLFAEIDLIIAKGMGQRLRNDLEAASVDYIFTAERNAQMAVELYLQNNLPTLAESACTHP